MKGLELVEEVAKRLAEAVKIAKKENEQLKTLAERLETELVELTRDAYTNGYSAGYAARDKLSCAGCGEIILDNGKKPS